MHSKRRYGKLTSSVRLAVNASVVDIGALVACGMAHPSGNRVEYPTCIGLTINQQSNHDGERRFPLGEIACAVYRINQPD